MRDPVKPDIPGESSQDALSSMASSESVRQAERVAAGEISQLPAKLSKRKGNRTGTSDKQTSDDKQRKQELKRQQRKQYILTLLREGKLSAVEARRMAKKSKITLEPSEITNLRVIEDPVSSGTKDDPYLVSEEREYQRRLSLVKEQGGRGVSLLSDKDMSAVIQLLALATGRYAACQSLGITFERFRNTYLHDDVFRSQVIMAEQSCIGICEMKIYEAATNGDLGAAKDFISIKARSEGSSFNRRMQVMEHRLKKAEHDLKVKAVETQLGMMQQQSRVSFSCFSDTELEEYNSLTHMAQSGEAMTEAQEIRLGLLSVKLMRANGTPQQPATNHVQEIASDAINAIDVSFRESDPEDSKPSQGSS